MCETIIQFWKIFTYLKLIKNTDLPNISLSNLITAIWYSLEIACTIAVLPVPGAPTKIMPQLCSASIKSAK